MSVESVVICMMNVENAVININPSVEDVKCSFMPRSIKYLIININKINNIFKIYNIN